VGPFVIVIPVSQEMITKSGIIFPATLWKLWNVAQVAKLAEREIYTCFKVNKKGKQIGKIRTFTRPDVKIGDIVLFQKWAPRGYDLGRGNIYFIHYEDIEISFQKGTFIYPM
jgi:co-chaperonin GroES (HSP10)